MTEWARVSFDFPPVKRRRIEARFSGGDITSDGGLLLLRQADRRPGLLKAVKTHALSPPISTAMPGSFYCARGKMENRSKEQQPGLFADRTGAHPWWTHQFRLLLSSLGYKQWGKGKVYLESRKYPLHSPSSGLTTWLHPTIANSAQNQRADEISRPGWFPFIIRSNPRKRAQKCVNDQHGVQRKCIGAIWKRWQPDAEDRFVWNVIIDQKTINFDMK